jgi:acyl dehydratase
MAISTAAIGKTYPPVTYAVGREKIREYALAVGETSPLHLDVDHAREQGYRDVVAPPMFCVVYCGPALGPAMFDPEVGIDFAHLLHSGQEFRWGPLVVGGDEVSTTLTVKDISARGDMGFYTFESVSTNQDGDTVCVGTWSNIVRG